MPLQENPQCANGLSDLIIGQGESRELPPFLLPRALPCNQGWAEKVQGMTYRVPNWGDYQGYKKRGPSWVKLHVSLLRKREWLKLPISGKALLPAIWIIASETGVDGSLTDDHETLAHLSGIKEPHLSEAVCALISFGFIEGDGVVANTATTPSGETEKRQSREEPEGEGESPRTESVEESATRLFREKNPTFEGKILEDIECPICYRSGNLKLTQARGSHPAGFWCDKRGGCGANWPLNTEAILSLMTPRGRTAIEAMMPAETKTKAQTTEDAIAEGMRRVQERGVILAKSGGTQ